MGQMIAETRRKKITPLMCDTKNAGMYCGLSYGSMAKLRKLGGGPEYRRVGKKVLYRYIDLKNWILSREVLS